jgi:hypothetical protein
VADEQGLDEIARLITDGRGVGRVIGARPSDNASCDIELLMLSRVEERYRLRNAVVGLDGLRAVRAGGFDTEPPVSVKAEDVVFSTLTEAMSSAEALIRSSRSRPIPDEGTWQARRPFLEGLTRPRLRSKISWLPQPPRWWDITRFVFDLMYVFAAFFLPVGPAIAVTQFVGWHDGLPVLLGFLLYFALLVLIFLLRERSAEVADMIERRLEGHRDGPERPGIDTGAASSRSETHGPVDGAPNEALRVAYTNSPPADAPGGADHDGSGSEALQVGSANASDGPEDGDLELMFLVLGFTVALAVGAALFSAASWLASWLYLNVPATRDSSAGSAVVPLVWVVTATLVVASAILVPVYLWRRSRPTRLKPEPPTALRYASPRPDTLDSGETGPVPLALRVTARTRILFLAGWLGCGIVWAAAGVVAQIVVGLVALTSSCIATAFVLALVGALGFQRRLDADADGVAVRNFVRRRTIPWEELRSIEVVKVDANSVLSPYRRLLFNDRVKAEIPVAHTEQGVCLSNLRQTLLSMQQANTSWQPPRRQEVFAPWTDSPAPHDVVLQNSQGEPEPAPLGQTASPHVQDEPTASHPEDVYAAPDPRDASAVQDD